MANSLPDATGYSGDADRHVLPARVLAIELRSLWMAVKRHELLEPVEVLERIARAADEFARLSEDERKGIPVPTLSNEQLQMLSKSFRC